MLRVGRAPVASERQDATGRADAVDRGSLLRAGRAGGSASEVMGGPSGCRPAEAVRAAMRKDALGTDGAGLETGQTTRVAGATRAIDWQTGTTRTLSGPAQAGEEFVLSDPALCGAATDQLRPQSRGSRSPAEPKEPPVRSESSSHVFAVVDG